MPFLTFPSFSLVGSVCHGFWIPTKLKNTRRLDYESAHETWNELLSNDWELVEHQFGACVDAA